MEGQHGSRWQVLVPVAAKIGLSAHMLSGRVERTELDRGARAGAPTYIAAKKKALERENCVLRLANEILCKVPACFAMADFDRPKKR